MRLPANMGWAEYVRDRTLKAPPLMPVASLSLAGVLVGCVGAFVLATMYDHSDPVQRVVGCVSGPLMVAIGIGLFVLGFFV
jgi:hypothetical protein